MLHKHILSYFNIIIILLLLHNVPWISFQLVYIIFSIKVFSHVLVYIYIYQSHIVSPVLLTDGDWKRLLGCTALLQGCDGHLITWLTEVIRHLHPTGVSARPWPPLPLRTPTISQSRFMHMAFTHFSCYRFLGFYSLGVLALSFFSTATCAWEHPRENRGYSTDMFQTNVISL